MSQSLRNGHTVLLLSGGLDSAVCLALEKPDVAMFVDYGQPHGRREHVAAIKLSRRFDTPLYCARLTMLAGWVPRDDSAMVVPGRNLILVSLAAAVGSPVVIGCNADDYENYVDCRPDFFDALAAIVTVKTPLIDRTKPEIVEMARDLGVPIDETWSCYYPTPDGACGRCDACKGRERALA